MGRGRGANCQGIAARREEEDTQVGTRRLETLYHVARRSARDAIASEGLRPNKPEDNTTGVFLWPTLDDAEEYGASGVHGVEADVYEVLVPVNELWEDDVWSCGAAYTDKSVPPERLKLIHSEKINLSVIS